MERNFFLKISHLNYFIALNTRFSHVFSSRCHARFGKITNRRERRFDLGQGLFRLFALTEIYRASWRKVRATSRPRTVLTELAKVDTPRRYT